MSTEDFGEFHAGLEAVEQSSIRKFERLAPSHAEDLRRLPGFFETDFGTRTGRGRFTVGEVDDTTR